MIDAVSDGGDEGVAAGAGGPVEKFDRLAETFSERDYADPVRYAARRAELVVGLGPRLVSGDTVLDLACGDGMMAAPLRARGLRYRGIDASARMVEVARSRNPGVPFEVGRFEDYAPPEPVDCVVFLRALKYVAERVEFFKRVRSYATEKLVLDVNLHAEELEAIVCDLRSAGFTKVAVRPFFLPQRTRLAPGLHPFVYALERAPLLAPLLSRRFGIAFCAASG